ncbi:MAG: acetoacetate decarboxylase [Burkholderiales bacterium]|nr:acetoacetate decarboxylase [Burkholderiales bacterium]
MNNKKYTASIKDIKKHGFSMPYTSPSALKIDYTFKNREYLIITYESDLDILHKVVPEPLIVKKPLVKFQFIKMPDAHGFGNYSLVGQTIEVEYEGKPGSYAHAMYLDNLAPIAAGREIWGFPEKLGNPELIIDVDTVLGTLKYNSIDVAIGTMGYKYYTLDNKQVKKMLEKTPNFLLKIIPDVNLQEACICQLIRYYLKNVSITGAWSGPASLQLFEHALAPVADLPVRRVISGEHIIADLTLGYGEIIYDYLID